jgi:hypothetical protein
MQGNCRRSSVLISMRQFNCGHIQYSAFVKYLRKRWEYNEVAHQIFTDFKKTYDSVRKDVLYSILIEFGISGN